MADEAAQQNQSREISRVHGYIGPLVYTFCEARLRLGEPEFRMVDLERYVADRFEQATPGSAGRILRLLGEQEAISYKVINRRSSLYRIESVDPTKRPT